MVVIAVRTRCTDPNAPGSANRSRNTCRPPGRHRLGRHAVRVAGAFTRAGSSVRRRPPAGWIGPARRVRHVRRTTSGCRVRSPPGGRACGRTRRPAVGVDDAGNHLRTAEPTVTASAPEPRGGERAGAHQPRPGTPDRAATLQQRRCPVRDRRLSAGTGWTHTEPGLGHQLGTLRCVLGLVHRRERPPAAVAEADAGSRLGPGLGVGMVDGHGPPLARCEHLRQVGAASEQHHPM
jgi:hypothetical protein